MASFGAGFMSGATQGSRMMKGWIDTYEQGQEDDMKNALFTAGQSVMQGRQGVDEEGNAWQEAGANILNMKPSDFQGMMIAEAQASGLKINDETAALAAGVGQKLFDVAQGYGAYQDKQTNQAHREDQYAATLRNTNQLFTQRAQKREMEVGGKWNPSGKKTHGGVGSTATQGQGGGSEKPSEAEADKISMAKYGVPYNKLKSAGRAYVSKQLNTSSPKTVKPVIPRDKKGGVIFKDIDMTGKLFKELSLSDQNKVRTSKGLSPKKSKSPKKDELDFSDGGSGGTAKSLGKAPKSMWGKKKMLNGQRVRIDNQGNIYPL